MLFDSPDDFESLDRKAVTLFGMSGVGKTHLADRLRKDRWFHFSVDYRIGTRHMGEFIVDNFKREAMKNPFLAQLLRSDSIYISSNITFANLDPLSTYLGRPGDPDKGGLQFEEYKRRQEQHRVAEIYALNDIPYFIGRAKELYGYDNFVADTGGSLIEVLDPFDAGDPLVTMLADNTVIVQIKGSEEDAQNLVDRFKKSPKPMYYRPDLLEQKWAEFKQAHGVDHDDDVDPDAFGAWGFEAILRDREPRYQALADNYGYTVSSADVATVRDHDDFLGLMRKAIRERATR
ncbi:hypothetical protein [Cucumibacter marinus]|uniref:hypothetical protein n=1 Tax=Cucumibacter marinus TaxID=1121252 RepID=UPI000426829B|nr:hypothetical protein [Cucumibacter marinus]